MDPGKDRPSWQLGRHILIIYAGAVAVALSVTILVLFTNIFDESDFSSILQLIWLIIAFGVILVLSRTSRILDALHENNAKLERIAETLEKNRSILAQIDESVRLSEMAKTIVLRDADRQRLREAVFDKLQQKDLDAAYQMIAEIAGRGGYKELAEQLQAQADKYRDSTDQEQTEQIISQVRELFENHEWVKASTEIEKLIQTFPNSDEAKALRQKLIDKKEERKRVLLTAWDDAVQRRATDRCLEILKDLDLYLTPNEGLALQEAAKDVFKTKLHNLGVQFSLAISGKNWARAIEIGQQITRHFPNSKMAGEIRGKMGVLKQKVEHRIE